MQYGAVLFAKRKPQRPGGNTGLRKGAELGGSTQPDLIQLPLSCLNPGHIPKKDRTYLITVMHHWWKKLKVVKSCQALMFMVIYRIIAVLPAGDFFASGEGDWSMCAEVTSNFTGLAQRKHFFVKEVLSTFWILGNFNNVSCWTLRTWQYSEFLINFENSDCHTDLFLVRVQRASHQETQTEEEVIWEAPYIVCLLIPSHKSFYSILIPITSMCFMNVSPSADSAMTVSFLTIPQRQ